MLQCVAVCCSANECVAVCCSVVRVGVTVPKASKYIACVFCWVSVHCDVLQHVAVRVAVCCGVCCGVCCSVFRKAVAVPELSDDNPVFVYLISIFFIVLQCVAVCCGVLQCVAVT